ncbi:tetratricopeptide repeat protein [Dongia deserti]|uniref:tetratricopeptide repeat protein n=1 Tax=Dongia deserti TaxID=2268030 RepID=UPI000E64F061|nr:tetratricopeptide repeat protein [Dongia deserti]
MKRGDLRAAAIVVLGLMALPGTAYALGTSSTPDSSKADPYKQAEDLIDDEEYAKAIPLLQKSIKEKGEYADALNLLGYANRKLGDKAKALTYYTKALNLEPDHLGANEYLGELYLEMNDLAKAEERLDVLKKACGDCDEYDDLADEIDDYKEEHGLS